MGGAGSGYQRTPTVSVAGTGLDPANCTVTMTGGDAARQLSGATAQTVTVTAS